MEVGQQHQDAAQAWAQEQLDREFKGQRLPDEQLAHRVIGMAMMLAALAKEAHLDEADAVQLVRSYYNRVTVLRKQPANV